jgi:predicted Zn finger-like uncharacterized protein
MNILCESCNTCFVVDDNVIGVEGKKVRCSKCGHVWYQEQIKCHDDVKKNMSISERLGISLPAVIDSPKRSTFNTKYIIFAGISVLIYLILVLFAHNLKITNDFVTQGLSVDTVEFEQQQSSGKVKLSYKILNNSTEVRESPAIKVRFFDNENNIIKAGILEDKILIEPQNYVLVETEFKDVTKAVKNLDVRLGTKLSMILEEFIK